jgi:uncharacterized phage-associated protein
MRFNETKATQAAARLLTKRGGQMSYMKLIKLLYLADREALGRWGRPITTDRYVSMDKGPVLSHILNRINDEPCPGDTSFWAEHIQNSAGYSVSLIRNPGDDKLSEAEDSLLDEIFAEFGSKTRWQLVDYVHTLPEWTDPHGGSLPIEYRDILKAQQKDPAEIEAIESELEGLAAIDRLCAIA